MLPEDVREVLSHQNGAEFCEGFDQNWRRITGIIYRRNTKHTCYFSVMAKAKENFLKGAFVNIIFTEIFPK
jgi:hypothetical protein